MNVLRVLRVVVLLLLASWLGVRCNDGTSSRPSDFEVVDGGSHRSHEWELRSFSNGCLSLHWKSERRGLVCYPPEPAPSSCSGVETTLARLGTEPVLIGVVFAAKEVSVRVDGDVVQLRTYRAKSWGGRWFMYWPPRGVELSVAPEGC